MKISALLLKTRTYTHARITLPLFVFFAFQWLPLPSLTNVLFEWPIISIWTIYCKKGRKELKRYGAIFAYLPCRVVHLEVVNSMDTDCFIQWLRRFIARGDNVRLIKCDNGTDLVAGGNELKHAFTMMDDNKTNFLLPNLWTDWMAFSKNPPAASHMGIVWERQIRSCWNILSSILRNHGTSLKDESLRTLVAEAEAIVNSRPVTKETLSDPTSTISLSPANLLISKTKVPPGYFMPPPGNFNQTEITSNFDKEGLNILQTNFGRDGRTNS